MTNVVDMKEIVDGDKTTLKGTGINQSEKPTEVNATDFALSSKTSSAIILPVGLSITNQRTLPLRLLILVS